MLFPDEISSWISGLGRWPSQCGLTSSNSLWARIEQKGQIHCLCFFLLAWGGTKFSALGLGPTPSASLVLRPFDSVWIIPAALLADIGCGTPAHRYRLWDFSASVIMWENSSNESLYLYLCLYLCPYLYLYLCYWFCSLETLFKTKNKSIGHCRWK